MAAITRPFPDLSDEDFNLLLCCAVPRLLRHGIVAALLKDEAQIARAQRIFGCEPYGARAADDQAAFALHTTVQEQCVQYLEAVCPDQYQYLLRAIIEYYLLLDVGDVHDLVAQLDEEFAYYLEMSCNRMLGARLALLADTLNAYQPGAHFPVSRRVWYYFQSFLLESEEGKYAAIGHLESIVADWPDDRITARAYNSLGFFLSQVNHFDAAKTALNKCLSLCAELGEAAQETFPKALTNMGLVYQRLGKYEQANEWTQRRLLLARQADDQVGIEIALHNLAHAEHRLGLWRLAEQHYLESLAICRSLGNRQSEAQTLLNLGEIYLLQGEFIRAETHLTAALVIFLGEEDQNLYEAVDVLFNMGFLYFVQGKYATAKDAYARAMAYLTERKGERTLLESQLYFQMGNLCRACDDAQNSYQNYRKALAIYEQVRAEEQTEDTRINVMGIGQHMYQTMVLFCVEQGDLAGAVTYAEQAKARSFLDMLVIESINTSRQSLQTLTAQEIQRNLPEQSILVEFYCTGEEGPDSTMLARLPEQSRFLREYLQAPKSLLLFIISPSRIYVERLHLSMERIAAQFFDRTRGRLLGITHDNRPLREMVRWNSLASHLFEPLVRRRENCRHVFLVPHGLLHLLPLHVFLTTQLPDVTCSFAPSASILFRIRSTKPSAQHVGNSLAIGANREGLLLSEWEAQHIAEQLGGQWLVGENATLKAVRSALANHPVIHFSCHGFFHRREPMHSGLMLADGELTAADILSQLDLDAEIVTLAACDTALSELAYGDDPLGLTRAFIGAGAKALLTTLWPIHEIPTTLFMAEFYRRWQQGDSAVQALFAAQKYLRELDAKTLLKKLNGYHLSQEVIEEQCAAFTARLPGRHPFDHPYYWGAFLLTGHF